jgi:hypothetical protein
MALFPFVFFYYLQMNPSSLQCNRIVSRFSPPPTLSPFVLLAYRFSQAAMLCHRAGYAAISQQHLSSRDRPHRNLKGRLHSRFLRPFLRP